MRVRNVHRRQIGSADRLGQLLDGLGVDGDRLWPGDRWPPMRLRGGLVVGTSGGHGPVRYHVEEYEPSRGLRFRFERPRGFDGFHEFRVIPHGGLVAELVHILDARMTRSARLSWPLVFRPLHDALIEDALDNAEREVTGVVVRPASWSLYVRLLRRVISAELFRIRGGPQGVTDVRRRRRQEIDRGRAAAGEVD
jgi:hypothetical protein